MITIPGHGPTSRPLVPHPRDSDSLTPTPTSAGGVALGSYTTKRGDRGPAVAALQKRLGITEDGVYGPETELAVRRYQAKHGCRVDGVVGPETRAALHRVSSHKSAPDSAADKIESPALSQKIRQQQSLIGLPQPLEKAHNRRAQTSFAPKPGRAAAPFAKDRPGRERQAELLLRINNVPLREGQTYAIQIDKDSPGAKASRQKRAAYIRSYTGQTSVFVCVNGRLRELTKPCRSASHPGQFGAKKGSFTDVNGDKKPDLAHLRVGAYQYRQRPNSIGRLNPTGNLPVARDINHNGVIDGAQENQDYRGKAMQFHAGGKKGPISAGCQTMPPEDFKRFARAVRKGRGSQFTYLLVRRSSS